MFFIRFFFCLFCRSWCQCSQGGHECKRSQAEGMAASKSPLSPRQQFLQEQQNKADGSDSDSSSLRSPRGPVHEPEHVPEVTKPVSNPVSGTLRSGIIRIIAKFLFC